MPRPSPFSACLAKTDRHIGTDIPRRRKASYPRNARTRILRNCGLNLDRLIGLM
jgi:hypothetical protein